MSSVEMCKVENNGSMLSGAAGKEVSNPETSKKDTKTGTLPSSSQTSGVTVAGHVEATFTTERAMSHPQWSRGVCDRLPPLSISQPHTDRPEPAVDLTVHVVVNYSCDNKPWGHSR